MKNVKYVSDDSLLLVRRQDLAKALQVSLGTIDNMRRERRLPEPLEISSRCVGWPKSVIDEWLDNLWKEHVGLDMSNKVGR